MKKHITFIETQAFTKRVELFLSDDDFAEFQRDLAANPRKGPVIQGTGGLRKVRWRSQSGGRSGGLRVIYLYLEIGDVIYLVYGFAKSETTDLTSDQKKQLKHLVEAIKREYTR